MKWHIVPFFIFTFILQWPASRVCAQYQECLFYFLSSQDSSLIDVTLIDVTSIDVTNAKGHILIPAVFRNLENKSRAVTIKDAFIELRIAAKALSTNETMSVLADADGKQLFHFDHDGDSAGQTPLEDWIHAKINQSLFIYT